MITDLADPRKLSPNQTVKKAKEQTDLHHGTAKRLDNC